MIYILLGKNSMTFFHVSQFSLTLNKIAVFHEFSRTFCDDFIFQDFP